MADDTSINISLQKLQPQERLKQLIKYSNQVEVDYRLCPMK